MEIPDTSVFCSTPAACLYCAHANEIEFTQQYLGEIQLQDLQIDVTLARIPAYFHFGAHVLDSARILYFYRTEYLARDKCLGQQARNEDNFTPNTANYEVPRLWQRRE